MVKVKCYTSIQNMSLKSWPTLLPHRPLLGEWVQSEDKEATLQIIRITHESSTETLLLELHYGRQ